MKDLSVAITHPEMLSNESDAIVMLLDEGVDYCHIRKPNATDQQLLHLVEAIPSHYHSRLTIHYHHHLNQKIKFGGIHESANHMIDNVVDARISKSCHSIRQVASIDKDYNYLFLSPIFNSISKKNYDSSFDHGELTRFLRHPQSTTQNVIALGGISEQTAPLARKMGFSGFALLGALWHLNGTMINQDQTIKNFQNIQKAWQNQ